jgi:crossover junction endodeoxyribonuclease RuvC
MRVLGIDPGVARLGYGVLETKGNRIIASAHGCFETGKEVPHSERLASVHKFTRELLKKYQPEAAAVEKLFFQSNAKTAIAVGEARGAVLLALAESNIPLVELTPLQVKMSVTGNGRADKRQVQKMVQILLKLEAMPKPDDAADALAIAICGHRYATTPCH